MPNYDFWCNTCQKSFVDTKTSMADHEAHPECPHCKSTDTEQDWTNGGPAWSMSRSRTN